MSEKQILEWADAYYARKGVWPKRETGTVEDAPGETWTGIQAALAQGGRGLSGGSSLAQLLAEKRGVRNQKGLEGLTQEQVLAWADAHYERTGDWPKRDSGAVEGAPGEKWSNIDACLKMGGRSITGGSSLAQLLTEKRGVRDHLSAPPLTVEQILIWADVYNQQTGMWPGVSSGPVQEAPGEIWSNANAALHTGTRGLPGGSSLAKLIREYRGVRKSLTEEQILSWAASHHSQTGKWPVVKSGPVIDAPSEKWASIDGALREGLRGLSGGSSLARLIKEHRSNPAS